MKKLILCFIFLGLLKAQFVVKSFGELKNQEIIRQNYEQSCGAASLATLLNLIDFKHFSELDILKKLGDKISTNMTSFAELKNAALSLGYQANSYKINREIFENIYEPILVKIESDPRFPHFVVAINHKGDFLEILDPNHGKYISLKNEFYSIWDKDKSGGYAILILPKIKTQRKLNLPQKSKFEFRPFGF